jgi:hypothetical protein
MKNQWWTSNLDRIQKDLTKAGKKAKIKPTPTNTNIYKTMKQKYKYEIKIAKKKWFHEKCSKIDNQWKLLKVMRKATHHQYIFSNVMNEPQLDPDLNALHILNSLLPDDNPATDSAQHQNIRSKVDELLKRETTTLSHPISISEVEEAIHYQKPFGGTGPDNIIAALLQWTSKFLSPILSNLFTACYNHSYYPITLKEVNSIVIPKTNKPNLKNPQKCLRLLSMGNSLSKVFEKIILDRLNYEVPNLFHHSQHGFIKGHSTESSSLDFLHFILKNLSPHQGVAAFTFDFNGAFDRAWHPSIIKNLSDKGYSNTSIKLIGSFLTNRKVTLKYGTGQASKTLTLSTPQGAILSPFIWDIFFDPLLEQLESLMKEDDQLAWADDLTLAFLFNKFKISQLEHKINKATNIVLTWAANNKAKINSTKSHLVCFHKSFKLNHTFHTPMGDFTPEDSLKLLGVTYDRHLNFLKHIKNITNNCSALVAEMTKYSAKDLHLPKSYLKDILSQVILPKLFYSILTWSQTKIKIIPYFTPIYN